MAIITPINFAIGLATTLFTAISALLGFFMMLKYIKFKDKQLLYVGLTWTALSTAWWGDSITFDIMLIFGNDVWLPDPIYFFLKVALLLPIFFLWPRVFGELLLSNKKNLRKLFIWSSQIWGVILEVIFLTILFLDYGFAGTRIGPFSAEWGVIIHVYLLFIALIFQISGIIFAYTAVQSTNTNIRKKGEILFFAFIGFFIGGVIEVYFGRIDIISLIVRIWYVNVALLFYTGFILPKFIKKIFKLET